MRAIAFDFQEGPSRLPPFRAFGFAQIYYSEITRSVYLNLLFTGNIFWVMIASCRR